uniref:Uncharacterized protein n=1 Tax=Geospiza parvula TaxID=87175 RepID=A0A8U8AL85_GEOPR
PVWNMEAHQAKAGQEPALEGQEPALEGQNQDRTSPGGTGTSPGGTDSALEGQEPAVEGQEPALEGQEPSLEGQEPVLEGQAGFTNMDTPGTSKSQGRRHLDVNPHRQHGLNRNWDQPFHRERQWPATENPCSEEGSRCRGVGWTQHTKHHQGLDTAGFQGLG